MRFCFIDEAGDSQPINSPTQNIQPLLVISGLFIDGSKIPLLTKEFIQYPYPILRKPSLNLIAKALPEKR